MSHIRRESSNAHAQQYELTPDEENQEEKETRDEMD